jgi:hypothetical protein
VAQSGQACAANQKVNEVSLHRATQLPLMAAPIACPPRPANAGAKANQWPVTDITGAADPDIHRSTIVDKYAVSPDHTDSGTSIIRRVASRQVRSRRSGANSPHSDIVLQRGEGATVNRFGAFKLRIGGTRNSTGKPLPDCRSFFGNEQCFSWPRELQ